MVPPILIRAFSPLVRLIFKRRLKKILRNCGDNRVTMSSYLLSVQDGGSMSIGFSHIDIVGEKVRLRPMRASDAGAAYKLVKNEAVLDTLTWDGPTNEEELLNTYRQWEEEIKPAEC